MFMYSIPVHIMIIRTYIHVIIIIVCSAVKFVYAWPPRADQHYSGCNKEVACLHDQIYARDIFEAN